jgi:hypothetical protein
MIALSRWDVARPWDAPPPGSPLDATPADLVSVKAAWAPTIASVEAAAAPILAAVEAAATPAELAAIEASPAPRLAAIEAAVAPTLVDVAAAPLPYMAVKAAGATMFASVEAVAAPTTPWGGPSRFQTMAMIEETMAARFDGAAGPVDPPNNGDPAAWRSPSSPGDPNGGLVSIQSNANDNPGNAINNLGVVALFRHESGGFEGPAVVQNLFMNLMLTNLAATIPIVPLPTAQPRPPDARAQVGEVPVPFAATAGAERLTAFAAPVEAPRYASGATMSFGADPPPARADLGPGGPLEAVAEPMEPAIVESMANPAALPLVADLIADALPVDRDLIAAAVDRFLEPLGDLGADLADADDPVSMTTEVLLVAGALGGLELARRRLRRGRSNWEAGVEGRSGSLSSPELPGAWSASRP